jgi:hypothetical protein
LNIKSITKLRPTIDRAILVIVSNDVIKKMTGRHARLALVIAIADISRQQYIMLQKQATVISRNVIRVVVVRRK